MYYSGIQFLRRWRKSRGERVSLNLVTIFSLKNTVIERSETNQKTNTTIQIPYGYVCIGNWKNFLKNQKIFIVY